MPDDAKVLQRWLKKAACLILFNCYLFEPLDDMSVIVS